VDSTRDCISRTNRRANRRRFCGALAQVRGPSRAASPRSPRPACVSACFDFFAIDPAHDQKSVRIEEEDRARSRDTHARRHRNRDQFAKFATCAAQTSRAKNLIDSW